MDRLIYTALNAIDNMRDQRVVSAQNLANMNVPGFRRDLANEGRAFYVDSQDGLTTRALQLERGRHGFSYDPGFVSQTGNPLDIAIPDEGFFYVQPKDGGEAALSRRGDLRIGNDRFLINGAGEQILDTGLAPIALPPFRDIIIDEAGRIVIEPQDGPPGERVELTTLASIVPDEEVGTLLKGVDGQIRQEDGTIPEPNQQARILQGALEGSNVDPTEELIASIDLQRSFELDLRMITAAQEMDEAGARLLRMPDG